MPQRDLTVRLEQTRGSPIYACVVLDRDSHCAGVMTSHLPSRRSLIARYIMYDYIRVPLLLNPAVYTSYAYTTKKEQMARSTTQEPA